MAVKPLFGQVLHPLLTILRSIVIWLYVWLNSIQCTLLLFSFFFHCYLQLNKKRIDFNSTQAQQVVTSWGCSPLGALLCCALTGLSLDGGIPVTVKASKLTPLDGGFTLTSIGNKQVVTWCGCSPLGALLCCVPACLWMEACR